MPSLRVSLLTVFVTLAQHPDREFVSRPCHVRFRHPANWIVKADTAGRDTRCGFSLRPVDWPKRLLHADSVDLFTTHLDVYPHGTWTVAAEHGFERRQEGWVVLGRQGIANPADSVRAKGWEGLRGIRSIGCFRMGSNDAYAGLCDAPSAVVGTATRAVVLEGGPQSEDLVDHILSTLRFTP
jgi:hypothetical protein